MHVAHSLIPCELFYEEDDDLASSAIPRRFRTEVVKVLRFLTLNDPKGKLPKQRIKKVRLKF